MIKALQFSGGVDSLACLWMLKDDPDVVAYWCKTDGAYPDMEAHIRRCCDAAGVPLKVIDGNRNLLFFGYPKNEDVESVFACCGRAIWAPMQKRMRDDKVDMIIRGQRDDDALKGVRDGHVDEVGIRYSLPIQDWTRAQVMEYLEDNCPDIIPKHYATGETTGHDCWDCTAYLFENELRIQHLPTPQRQFVMAHIGR